MANASTFTDFDLRDADALIHAFNTAADLSNANSQRTGSLVNLPAEGKLLMTGDLHDNSLNFQRVLKLAALDESPDNRLVLHEVIHGAQAVNGMDLSVATLARVAALKLSYPDQVFVLLSNHELAQHNSDPIMKHGLSVIDMFNQGIEMMYAGRGDDIRTAMNRYIRSMLLGIRCANGLFCAHSLPSPRYVDNFDDTVFDREYTDADLQNGGAAFLMVWGRFHKQVITDEFAQRFNTKQFLLGHQAAEMGYDPQTSNSLVLASDHEHGVALPLDLSVAYDENSQEQLIEQIRPLASVVVR